MKTRTLLLLAVCCGLAILVAGGVQLLRVTDEPAVTNPLGAAATIADLDVTVEGASESGGIVYVDVTVGGVDDADAIHDGFRLVVPGRALEPVDVDGRGDVCGPVTDDTQTCVVAFDVTGIDSSARVLLVRRGDEQARWELDRN